eukprot:233387_1
MTERKSRKRKNCDSSDDEQPKRIKSLPPKKKAKYSKNQSKKSNKGNADMILDFENNYYFSVHCHKCKKHFKEWCKYIDHIKAHYENGVDLKWRTCDYTKCKNKSFISNTLFVSHIANKHTNDKPFKCSLCTSSFGTKSNTKVHFKKYHSNSSKQQQKPVLNRNKKASDKAEASDSDIELRERKCDDKDGKLFKGLDWIKNDEYGLKALLKLKNKQEVKDAKEIKCDCHIVKITTPSANNKLVLGTLKDKLLKFHSYIERLLNNDVPKLETERIQKLEANKNKIKSVITFKEHPFVKEKVDNILDNTVNEWTDCTWGEFEQKYKDRNAEIVKWGWVYMILTIDHIDDNGYVIINPQMAKIGVVNYEQYNSSIWYKLIENNVDEYDLLNFKVMRRYWKNDRVAESLRGSNKLLLPLISARDIKLFVLQFIESLGKNVFGTHDSIEYTLKYELNHQDVVGDIDTFMQKNIEWFKQIYPDHIYFAFLYFRCLDENNNQAKNAQYTGSHVMCLNYHWEKEYWYQTTNVQQNWIRDCEHGISIVANIKNFDHEYNELVQNIKCKIICHSRKFSNKGYMDNSTVICTKYEDDNNTKHFDAVVHASETVFMTALQTKHANGNNINPLSPIFIQDRWHCNNCDKSYKYLSAIKNIKKHNCLEKFKCKECGKEFTNDSHRKFHEASHNMGWKCDYFNCIRYTNSWKSLKMHRENHVRFDDEYHSDRCNISGCTVNIKKGMSPSEFCKHLYNESGFEVNDKCCPGCGKTFDTTKKRGHCWRKHHHNYKCDKCDCGYTDYGFTQLKEHRKKHSRNDSEFDIEVCNADNNDGSKCNSKFDEEKGNNCCNKHIFRPRRICVLSNCLYHNKDNDSDCSTQQTDDMDIDVKNEKKIKNGNKKKFKKSRYMKSTVNDKNKNRKRNRNK